MKVLCYPSPVLSTEAETVTGFDEALARTAQDMLATMAAASGVGLAAPQVGVSIRLAVLNLTGDPEDELILVNPEIVASADKLTGEEGCLSFPGIYIKIQRAGKVTVRYQDLGGAEQTLEAEGLLSRAVQHELDHLAGVLLVDHMTPVQHMANRRALKMLELRHSGKSDAFLG